MSVVAVNAMTRAVLAPKAAGAKPRASAFVGRPAALKARVAGTRSIPPREPPPPARRLDLVLFPPANKSKSTRDDDARPRPASHSTSSPPPAEY